MDEKKIEDVEASSAGKSSGLSDDTRRLTSPTLRIRGDAADEGAGQNCSGGSNATSTPLGWLLGLLHCRRQRKEWRTNTVQPQQQFVVDEPATATTNVSSVASTPNAMLVRKHSRELNFAWLASNATSEPYKVLLVFARDDQQSEILGAVARKLGWSVSEARNAEEASELLRERGHELVIVDRRSHAHGLDADEICRTLLRINSKRICNIVALVKKSFFTSAPKEDVVILHLLNIGYNRALLECSHEGILMNELIAMHAVESQPKSHLTAARLLYLAVDKSRDIVHVTNDQHIVQFANRTSERLLGYRPDELVGRHVMEFMMNENWALMDQQLQKGREFEGSVSWRKRPDGILNINCRIVPMSLPASNTTYYVYIYESIGVESVSSTASVPHYTPRGSVQYGRHSLELRNSHKPRRSTLTKSHNLHLEAPITKAITVLANIVEASDSSDVSTQIEAAIEILKDTKLYSPRLKEEDLLSISDPITADLLGGLMDIAPNEPRKSSTSLGRRSQILNYLHTYQNQMTAKLPRSPHCSQELESLLELCFEWDFDIFKLETLSGRRPLFYLGATLMTHYRVAERLDCDETTLQNWLMIIEANYNENVTYHNSTHATDVLQAIAGFMRSDRLQLILDPLDEVAALIAAAAHDVGHPGKSSQFLCNASHKLAILYNDLTVLESHHSALTFRVTLADDNVNIFKNLPRDVYKSMRQNIIDMILATEMTKHFEHLAKFANVCSCRMSRPDTEAFAEDPVDMSAFMLPENVTLTKRMMIKCADVSNPTRPMKLYMEWSRRIAEEYFDQTDEEKKKLLPVVMPMFDRTTCSIPKSQIGFVDYIITDMMEAWDAFIDMPVMIGNMRENYEKWKRYSEQGIMTLEDIKKLQETPELQLYKRPSKVKF